MFMQGALEGQKRALAALQLQFQLVVSSHVVAGDFIPVLWRKSVLCVTLRARSLVPILAFGTGPLSAAPCWPQTELPFGYCSSS